MKAVYSVLVPTNTSLNHALADRELWMLYQRRHLIVHRRGVVDQAYLDATGETFTIGTHLTVTPDDFEKALSVVVSAGTALGLSPSDGQRGPTSACSGPELAGLSWTSCRWRSCLPAAEARRSVLPMKSLALIFTLLTCAIITLAVSSQEHLPSGGLELSDANWKELLGAPISSGRDAWSYRDGHFYTRSWARKGAPRGRDWNGYVELVALDLQMIRGEVK